jgi:transposase-like protein
LSDDLRGRWGWKAMPWAKHTACAACGEMHYCHGRSPERMVCLSCFTDDEDVAKLRRGGQKGRRSGYRYTRRRPKQGMVELVRAMRDEGLVVGAIAKELGISEKTVRNYLSESRRAEKRSATPLSIRDGFPRKEEARSSLVLTSGDT